MTKKMKKSLMITSLLATSFLTFGAISSLNTVETKASTADFTTTTGASVRISEPNGIRFRLELSTAKKNEIFAENSGKTLGMYIVRGNKIGEDYSTLSQKINLSFTEDDLYQIGNVWYANGVMTNLYVQNFNKEFVGVGYIATTVGETTTYEYTQVTVTDNARSMSNVAIEAYKDPKANVQDEMVALLEKAVYADYGVVETRTMDGNTITGYSFTDGVTTWTSYANMQEELPISLSVAEKDLTLGETLDLNASLTVKDTKITGLDLPFAYSVDSDAVTLENGVLTAAKEGTANVTVSFGKYIKTVEINVTEKANVVFNPADVNSASQISYNDVFDNGIKEFVSAEENEDMTYGGAYLRAVGTAEGTNSAKITSLQPKFDNYNDYDLITVWLYLKSENNTAVEVYIFNDVDLTQYITPNEWVQVKIARSKFMANISTATEFLGIPYSPTGVTEIWLGEIVAENYDESTNFVFDPTVADTTRILANKSSTIVFKQASKNENADAFYAGAYARVSPNGLTTSNTWVNISITPIKDVATYSNYTHIKIWLYVKTGTTTEVSPLIGGVAYTFMSNQWVDIDVPASDFAQPIFGTNFSSNATWGITLVCIGEVKAITKEARTDVFFFDPTATDATSKVSATGKAFNYGNSATYSVGKSAMADYKGSYVQIDSTALTSSNQSGNAYVMPSSAGSMSAFADYTTVKAWIYLKAIDTAQKTVYLFGAALPSITSNQWVQIEIPVNDTFLDAESIWLQTNFAKASTWGVTAIRIGEITAVK